MTLLPHFLADRRVAALTGRQSTRVEMAEGLTPREQELAHLLARKFPGRTVTADFQEVEKPSGCRVFLRICLDRNFSVEVDRERIAWPPETMPRLAEAIEVKFELLGLERAARRIA
jgi:hypothetical protein